MRRAAELDSFEVSVETQAFGFRISHKTGSNGMDETSSARVPAYGRKPGRAFRKLFAWGLLLASPATAWSQQPAIRQPGGVEAEAPKAIEVAPHAWKKEDSLIQSVVEPELIFQLEPTRSKLVRTRMPVSRIAITDPMIVEVIQYGPNEFEFIGRQSGETTLTLWFGQPLGQQSVLRYLVKVGPDESKQIEAEIEYGDLQTRINEMFPNSQIQLIPIIDKLIVRGQARDAEEAAQIMAIIRGSSVNQQGIIQNGINTIATGQVARIPGADDLPTATVISLLNVPGEQQVMLKVRIAELTRTAARELGTSFNVLGDNFAIASTLGGAPNISAILDAGDVELFVRAFSSNGHGKILAEPTLVTLSGHTATFIAGGEFAVPTAVGVDGISAASTTFRGFGTQLAFTPTVLDKDRVRLNVVPSFSSLNQQNAVDGIPGLNTRAVATTVDLREGQWLAIAGLIQDEQGGSRVRIPGIGDIPVIGAAFGLSKTHRDETELVVLVSPELVHPLEAEQVPLLLPGMEVTDPTDTRFFLGMETEGNPNCFHRSTIWPQPYRRDLKNGRLPPRAMPLYTRSQGHYLCGPKGFSE